MNIQLTEQIVKHIFSGFIWASNSRSLIDNDFLLNEKIKFEIDEDAKILLDTDKDFIENNLFGCQITIEQKELKVLLADCSQDGTFEMAMIVSLKEMPSYGLYLSRDIENEPIIACTLDGNAWMKCNTYLQATFLAGMEQIREAGLGYVKCTNYEEQHKLMLSFINFCFSDE